MNCPESRELLQRRLDGEFWGDAALEQHLAGCPACRDLETAGRRVETALRTRDRPVPPAGLAERIVERLLRERRARLRWRRAAVAATVAASFVAVASAYQLWFAAPRSRPTPVPVAKERAQPGAPASPLAKNGDTPAAPSAPSLDESVKDAGSALVGLTRRTADETIGQGRLLLPDVTAAAPRPTADLWQRTLEPPARSLREAGAGVSTGLGPVADSARRAVHMFLDEIPPVQPDDRPGL